MSPRITVVLFQVASESFSVFETTYLRRPFILSPKPSASLTDGHAFAKPWYVTRPNRSAPAADSSSSLNLSPSGPRLNLKDQPPCLYPSAPPGSSITPSSETNSLTTTFMMFPPSERSPARAGRHPLYERSQPESTS